jgi:hypothetical protein
MTCIVLLVLLQNEMRWLLCKKKKKKKTWCILLLIPYDMTIVQCYLIDICLTVLISTKGTRWVWPVSRGCLLLRDTWSYLCICRGSVFLYTWVYNCFLGYDCVLHIVNFVILYFSSRELKAQERFSNQNLSVVCRCCRCRKLVTFSSPPPELLG